MSAALLLVATGAALVALSAANLAPMGKYECVRVVHVKACEDSAKDTIRVSINMGKDKKEKRIMGYFENDMELPCVGISGNMTMWKWNAVGGWHEIGKGEFQDSWSQMNETAPDVFGDFCKASGIEPRCPVPKGRHTFHDYDTCLKLKNFPDLMYGLFKYMIIVRVYGKRVACFQAEVNVEK